MKALPLEPADRAIFQRSARSIGLQVALLSLAMIAVGGLLVALALWWKIAVDPQQDPGKHYLEVAIDWVDLVIAALIIGVVAVAVAGSAAFFFAARATRPLADALARQRNFVADASHELRTPLAVMHARVQQLGMVAATDERVTSIVQELKQDTQEMVDIVDDLLHLASVSPSAEGENTELGPVLKQVESEQALLAHEHAVSLRVEDSVACVAMPEVSLHRALTALVVNALGHAPTGGHVDVRLTEGEKNVHIRVIDDGPGIRGIEPSRVFERFAQGTGSKMPSHGIGLALVHETVSRCGGEVTVEHTGPEGTTFLLSIPRSNQS